MPDQSVSTKPSDHYDSPAILVYQQQYGLLELPREIPESGSSGAASAGHSDQKSNEALRQQELAEVLPKSVVMEKFKCSMLQH